MTESLSFHGTVFLTMIQYRGRTDWKVGMDDISFQQDKIARILYGLEPPGGLWGNDFTIIHLQLIGPVLLLFYHPDS